MKIIADLHIHSPYSRATSPRLTPPWQERWARIKGLDLLGTGDCTHPLWLSELRRQMDDAEDGFYTLKKEIRGAFDSGPAMTEGLPKPRAARGLETPRFVITGEISTIYKRDGKTRKIHHLVILPDFRAAAVFNARLESLGGNIRSDGRPILGMDSRDLLEILLETDGRSLLVPAHIWTPWFSALGANSGFDSIEECYRDLAGHIDAVETGLSSNPPMNWALKSLDRFSIISNSDAHSPDKFGREATLLEMDLSFASLRRALSAHSRAAESRPGEAAVLGTVEFFPQEGKYHYAGHRKCGVSLPPGAAAEKNYLCPVCGKPLTRGVMERVLELADRPVNEAEVCPPEYEKSNRRPYYALVPLREITAELLGAGAAAKKTTNAYNRLIEKCGNEFSILMDMSRKELEKTGIPEISGSLLSEAVMKMRDGDVLVTPGYDGEYGKIRLFGAGAERCAPAEESLFGELPETETRESGFFNTAASAVSGAAAPGSAAPGAGFSKNVPRKKAGTAESPPEKTGPKTPPKIPPEPILDAEQEKAVAYNGDRTIIIAGPGTGKTAVLTARAARLVRGGAGPETILALTFTVKAAAELRARLDHLCGGTPLTAATFHSFCCSVLREHSVSAGLPPDFKILEEGERDSLLKKTGGKHARKLGQYIEERKRRLLLPGQEVPKFPGAENFPFRADELPPLPLDAALETLYGEYRNALKKSQSLDFEDLTAGTVRLLVSRPEILEQYCLKFRHIFIDEYQDLNFSQYLLVRVFTSAVNSPSLWVIGDPNQAIYGFRGSDRRFIDRFLSDYPGAGHFTLRKTYRCAGPIINAAGKLIGTRLLAGTPGGSQAPGISLYRACHATEKSEAEYIARTIEGLVGGTSFFALDSAENISWGGGGLAPEDCAVLVRVSFLAGPVIKALKDHGIPFVYSGGQPWWKPDGAFLDALRNRKEKNVPNAALPRLVKDAWEEFAERENPGGKKRGIPEGIERLTELAELFGNLSSLLDALDSCAASGIPEFPRSAGVKVMTIHASKGLEFEHVFIPGLEEGILPFTLFDKASAGRHSPGGHPETDRVEEEKRLLYVAMTRAKRGLWLSRSESRNIVTGNPARSRPDSAGRKFSGEPSRFLSELEKIIPLAQDKSRKRDGQLKLF